MMIKVYRYGMLAPIEGGRRACAGALFLQRLVLAESQSLCFRR